MISPRVNTRTTAQPIDSAMCSNVLSQCAHSFCFSLFSVLQIPLWKHFLAQTPISVFVNIDKSRPEKGIRCLNICILLVRLNFHHKCLDSRRYYWINDRLIYVWSGDTQVASDTKAGVLLHKLSHHRPCGEGNQENYSKAIKIKKSKSLIKL